MRVSATGLDQGTENCLVSGAGGLSVLAVKMPCVCGLYELMCCQ